MATTIPPGSRDDPRVGSAGTGTSSRRAVGLPRPRTPEADSAMPVVPPVTGPRAVPFSTPVSPDPARAASDHADATPFLELLEDVLAGGSLMGRQRPGLRERGRRWLLPVGTSGEPLILFCGWVFALAIALAAYADFGPFSGPSDAGLMVAAEAILTAGVLGALALAKARRRAPAGRSALRPTDDRTEPALAADHRLLPPQPASRGD